MIYSLRSRVPPGTVRVDRTTQWGNRISFLNHATAKAEDYAIAVARYKAWAIKPEQAEWREEVKLALKGKDLACWCKPNACHADILHEIANN
jgi:hypothetical protein